MQIQANMAQHAVCNHTRALHSTVKQLNKQTHVYFFVVVIVLG